MSEVPPTTNNASHPAINNAPAHVNRLANETSPYLLQHQFNPVDWYAWGPEAFAAARAANKPIFLSVGYSTCYWCHVMERESFENEAIAAEMNQRFINIKVDREERPDVDQLYMTFVQLATHHGGWPMSVFLTPQLKPFYGGTYFPPADTGGRPGFVRILQAVDDAWHNRPDDVAKATGHYTDILRRLAEPPRPSEAMKIDRAFVDSLVQRSMSDYDSRHGGFGSSPKFPRETLLEMLLIYNRHHPDASVMRKVRHTLDALETGGIHDHLGGGFHRYSTDSMWLIPHFEIMLYDNAMLAWVFVEAYAQTQEARYSHVARGIMDFVLREMTSPQGAFFTAFDAEVDAQEGLSYLWTAAEIESLLGAEAGLFGQAYGISRGPNFADPHHGSGTPDKNILYLPEPLDRLTERWHLSDIELYDRLTRAKQVLYAARLKRKQPLLDTKILTSWNALMIRALAYGSQVLQDDRYLRAAVQAAEFLLLHHRTPDGGLYRTSRPHIPGVSGQRHQPLSARDRFRDEVGQEERQSKPDDSSGAAAQPDAALDSPASHAAASELVEAPAEGAKVAGFLDDYAFLIQALIALHDAGADERFKDAAHALSVVMRSKFGDPEGAFYFTQLGADDLIIRQKTASDSPLPSGNAVAAMSLLEMGDSDSARETLAVFAASLERGGEGMSSMLQAAILYLQQHSPIHVTPDADPSSAEAERPTSPRELAEKIVDAQAEWTSPLELRLYVNVLKNFHLNAHAAINGLIATELQVTGSAAAKLAGIDYPPGQERRLSHFEQPLRLYEGNITFVLRFTEPVNTQATIPLTLTYQACDESACLPPVTRHFEVPTV